MGDTKHTPGPWLLEDGKFGAGARIQTADGQRIASVLAYRGWAPADHVEANARLIAAAPDMRAALARLLRDAKRFTHHEHYESMAPAFVDAENALAKARGDGR